MAVTGPESQIYKKSRHKKSLSGENVFNNSRSGNVSEEQDDSETDLDKPLFKLPHQSRAVSNLQTANGNISDSETDVEKPLKITEVHKSFAGMQHSKSTYNAQFAVQRSDTVEDEDSDENQSMSLLQMHSAKISKKKSNQHSVNNSQKSGSNSLLVGDAVKGRVIRKPTVAEMSPSESESDSEDDEKGNHHNSRPQPQTESESEEEHDEDEPPLNMQVNQWTRGDSSEYEDEDEEQTRHSEENNQNQQLQQQKQQQQIMTDMNTVRIKQEPVCNSESSSFEEDDPPPLQEFPNNSLLPPVESGSASSQRKSTSQNPSGVILNTNPLSDIAKFEQEHTRVSAPVIEIPQDSRVWVLQVPRSIKATHLHGQYLPKKLKGGEFLNLRSGHWQILDQPYEASRSILNCIVSSGDFCYGMRWLQPRGYWYLKHMKTPLQMDTDDAPWKQEIAPLSIKELLKMKSNPAVPKEQHLKPSKERHQDSDLVLPSKRSKGGTSKETSSNINVSIHKKKKHQVQLNVEEHSTMEGGEAEKRKKRKHTSEVNEESPKKKKKKNNASLEDDQSHLEAAENIDFRKKEKQSKHKDGSVKRFRSQDSIVKVKLENTANDSEWREHSSSHDLSGSSYDKKQKRHKKSHVEQGTEKHYMEMEQNESIETTKKEKKKKRKHKNEESVQGETLEMYENKIKKEVTSPANFIGEGTEKPIKKEKKKHSQQGETSLEDTETDIRKKKKHKHHYNKVEGDVSVPETEEDTPVKKKKKHKHKEFNEPKVKQEDFWEQETSSDFLSRLYLTQITPEDK